MAENPELLRASKAWPVVEAVKLIERVEQRPPAKGFVLFETGYGPSGLPHIGTFAEVFRTSLVRQAFARLSDWPTRLYAFSDDMDGLRAVPDNIPEPREGRAAPPQAAHRDPRSVRHGRELRAQHERTVSSRSSTASASSTSSSARPSATAPARFNDALRRVLERHEAIRRVVLPTLGAERRETYSPILPVSPTSGRVLQVPILDTDPAAGTVTYRDPDSGQVVEQSVLDGQGKLQWRPDWAMRWAALEVDYEMYGKDLIDSAKLSGAICKILGGTPPAGFAYEMFLDEHGQKISKSKGNGLSCDEWLTYGTLESLKLFMFQAPRKAKRLYFDVIPRNVDDYFGLLERYPGRARSSATTTRSGTSTTASRRRAALPISFAMLLNLASVVERRGAGRAVELHPPLRPRGDAGERAACWTRWSATRSPTTGTSSSPPRPTGCPTPPRRRRSPSSRGWLEALRDQLRAAPATLDAAAEAIQQEVYEIGKRHGYADDLRGWFQALYEILLGQTEGPRFGSFVGVLRPGRDRGADRAGPGRPADRPAGGLTGPLPMRRADQRAPARARRARPRAGRAPPARRGLRRPPGAGRLERARPRRMPACWSRPRCAASARSTPCSTRSCAPGRSRSGS